MSDNVPNETPARRRGDRILSFLFGLVLVVMAVELIFLARQNRELKSTVSRLQGELLSARSQGIPRLEAGEIVLPVELQTVDGNVDRLAFDDPARDTVLLFFSPDCAACEANLERWRTLREASDPGRRRLLYVSMAPPDKTVSYAKDHGFLDAVRLASVEIADQYKVHEIPTTVLVEPGGLVTQVWRGQLSDEALQSLVEARPAAAGGG